MNQGPVTSMPCAATAALISDEARDPWTLRISAAGDGEVEDGGVLRVRFERSAGVSSTSAISPGGEGSSRLRGMVLRRGSGLRRRGRRGDRGRWRSRCRRRRGRRRPGRRWCRSRRRSVERVDGHGVAQDVDVAVLLGEAVGERLPLVAAGAAAEDAELAIEGEVLGVALDGDDVDGFGLVGVDVDDEAEVGGQIAADLVPVVAGVVGAHDVPVLLHEERVGARAGAWRCGGRSGRLRRWDRGCIWSGGRG